MPIENQLHMKITLFNHLQLDEIPSGSGIAKCGKDYYVIGDDSPFLFKLDKNLKIAAKTLISEAIPSNGNRIIKSEKPDFETLELINENELLIFGSGSKSPQRDVFVRVFLNDPMIIDKYDLSKFYNHLRNLPIFENSELNIEATAYHHDQLYLFNRRKNLILKFDYQHFLQFLKGESPIPKLEIKEYSLPKIKGIEAGFSGATTLKKNPKIIFTGSVEDTVTAYDDGEILGSFIGMIDISNNSLAESIDYCPVPNPGEILKIESITVLNEQPGETEIMMITDDDQGSSILIHGVISW